MFLLSVHSVMTTINIIAYLGTILGVIMPFLMKVYAYHRKIKYIKNTLCSKNKNVLITIGVFHAAVVTRATTYDMVTVNTVKCVKTLVDFCNTVNLNVYLQGEYTQADIDELHIGGPLRNIAVSNLLANFFGSTFRFLMPKEDRHRFDEAPINDKFIEYTESELGFSFGAKDNEKKYLSNAKYGDYAIIIRLLRRNKSIHILFGGYGLGTVSAVEYFVKHTKELYNFAKDNKRENSNYFFILHVNNDGKHDANIGLTDLTDTVFANS